MKKSSENSFKDITPPHRGSNQNLLVLNVALSIIHHDTGGKQKRKVKEIFVAALFVYEPIPLSGFTLARIQGI